MFCIVVLTWDKSYRNRVVPEYGHLMCLCFIKTTGRGVRPSGNIASIPSCLLDFELWINKAIPKIESISGGFQYAIREDGQFFVSPARQYEFLFFSSGVNDSELWGYIFREREEQTRSSCLTSEVGKLPGSRRQMQEMEESMGMDLTVALETGGNIHVQRE